MELYNKENAPPTIMNTFDLEFEKGKIEGKIGERHTIAQKLILEKLPLEMVSTATGLTLEEVKEIQKMLN